MAPALDSEAAREREVVITGRGLVCSVAASVPEFSRALFEGRCGVRLLGGDPPEEQIVQVGALIEGFSWIEWLASMAASHPEAHRRARKVLHNAPEPVRHSACAVFQALAEAGLLDQPAWRERSALIVGGNNLHQGFISENLRAHLQRPESFNPKYALGYQDTHQLGCLSEIFSIRGPGMMAGGASASGNVACFNAWHWIRAGLVERCLVVGAGSDLSSLELEAFGMIGAAAAGEFRRDPDRVCRPFDARHEGFVYGQGSACIVLETAASARARSAAVYGELAGVSLCLDGNHSSEPSAEGEARAMRAALESAALAPGRIDYVNAHGTSSPLGDRTECAALRAVFGAGAASPRINSTKSIAGHCLSAAGVIELMACLAQFEGGFLHPNRNLETPIDPDLRFVAGVAEPFAGRYALSNGFGFGGINSSLVIKKS